MQPVEFSRHAHPGFVGVGDGDGFQCFADGGHRRREKRAGFLVDRQHRGIRHRQAEQAAGKLAGACHRHHVVVGQMHHGGLDARPVLHRRRDIFGKLAPVYLAASAARFENLVFGDFVTQGRNVEHLAGFDHDCVGQRLLASGAMARRAVGFDVIRVLDFFQGMAGVARLSAGRVLTRFAQRLRLGFGLVQSVRGGRFAGVAAVLRQTAFEPGNLGGQRGYLREQRTDQAVLFGYAEKIKVGQGFHALYYRHLPHFL